MPKIVALYYTLKASGFHGPRHASSETEITIGRDTGCDVHALFRHISRDHGVVTVDKSMLGKTVLKYEDKSTHGSSILTWSSTKVSSKSIHHRKVTIGDGDWIVLLRHGEEGLVIVPKLV